MNRALYLLVFFIGIDLVLLVGTLQSRNTKLSTSISSASPTPNTLSNKVNLLQPKDVVSANLESPVGKVDKIPWDSFDKESIVANTPLYQGDEIITYDLSSVSLSLGDFASIKMNSNTDIEVTSIVNAKVLIHQKSGQVNYAVDGTMPLNIKAGRSLLYIVNGEFNIVNTDTTTKISVKKGEIKLATDNNNSVANVWQITSGKSATVYESTGRVVTNAQLLK